MISIKNIFSGLTSMFKNRSAFHHKSTLHPTREWLIGLLMFCFFVGIGGVQSARVFLKHQDVHAGEGEFTETIPQYNQTMVDKAEALYSKRKEAFLNLQNNTVPSQAPLVKEVIETPITEVVPDTATETEIATSTASTTGGIELAN